jgi:hypothetical protein
VIVPILQKILLLPILFAVPSNNKGGATYGGIEQSIIKDDWSSFYLSSYLRSSFKGKSPSPLDRASLLLEKRHIQKAFEALSSSPPVSITESKVDILQRLHPKRSPFFGSHSFSSNFDIITTPIIFDSNVVLTKVNNHKRHSSPGITKLRFEHLKQCVGLNNSTEEKLFLEKLTDFLNRIVNATLPSSFMKTLASSVLIAIPKPGSNEDDVRPIAMGEVYRKLAASLLLNKYQNKIDSIMGKIQLGIGVKCGVEKIIHLSTIWRANDLGDIVLIDFKNAFNTVSRDVALSNFNRLLPELYPYMLAIYGIESHLWFSIDNSYSFILSSEGAQQGDPLGPLFFAVAIIPLLEELQSQLHNGYINAYIDDLTQLAKFENQCQAIVKLKELAPQYGLKINFSKFKILMTKCGSVQEANHRCSTYTEICPGIIPSNIILHPDDDPDSLPEAYGLEILGSPVGSDAFVQYYLYNITSNSLPQELARLDTVKHLQSLWCFIHYIVKAKITHLLRTIPPSLTQSFVSNFMVIQMDLTRRVFNIEVTSSTAKSGMSEGITNNNSELFLLEAFNDHKCREQLKLPIAAGGMGLRHLQDITQAAFLSSVVICFQFLTSFSNIRFSSSSTFLEATSAYNYWSDHGTFKDEDIIKPSYSFESWIREEKHITIFKAPKLQKKLTGAMVIARIRQFSTIIQSSTHSKVRLGAINQSLAGCFLTAWPKPEWKLSNEEFYTILRFRHGLPVIPIHPILQCNCYRHTLIDYYGDHLLCCICGPQIIHRHNQLVHVFRSLGRDAGIRSSSNFKYILTPNSDNSKHQVDFIFFQPNITQEDHGRDYLFDISVVHPTAPSYLQSNKVNPSSSLHHSTSNKIEKHRANAEAQGKQFTPLVFYTYGMANEDVKQLLHFLSERHSERLGCHFSVSFFQMATSINITLLRGTARVLLDRYHTLISNTPSSNSHTYNSESLINIDTSNSHNDFIEFSSQFLIDNDVNVLPDLASSR